MVCLALPASGHLVLARSSLREYVRHSHAAVWVEFVSPLSMWKAADGLDRQEFFRVRVLERIAGESVPDELDFFPHSEGAPRFQRGDRALLFLEETATRQEFAGLASRFPFFSVQGPGEEWRAQGDEEASLLGISRAYAKLTEPDGPSTAQTLKTIWLRQLDSGVTALQADAIADLVRTSAARGLWTTATDVEPFAARIHSPALSLSQRLSLLHVFENRPGFDAMAHWRRILAVSGSSTDVELLIQQAASVDNDELGAWIASQLAPPPPASGLAASRLAAARALRHPWHAAQVPVLAAALSDADARVARAAAQSLGAVGTEEARLALRAYAGEAPTDRRRWAEAALRRIGE